VARAAPAGGRRAPAAVLRPPDGGAPGDRVRVHQPAGVRDVDQGRGAAAQPRRRAEAPSVMDCLFAMLGCVDVRLLRATERSTRA
jgi:hypothetical protein